MKEIERRDLVKRKEKMPNQYGTDLQQRVKKSKQNLYGQMKEMFSFCFELVPLKK